LSNAVRRACARSPGHEDWGLDQCNPGTRADDGGEKLGP
jgi:hypothetical protein